MTESDWDIAAGKLGGANGIVLAERDDGGGPPGTLLRAGNLGGLHRGVQVKIGRPTPAIGTQRGRADRGGRYPQSPPKRAGEARRVPGKVLAAGRPGCTCPGAARCADDLAKARGVSGIGRSQCRGHSSGRLSAVAGRLQVQRTRVQN